MRMWMWMPQAVQLLFVMSLWVMQGQAQLEADANTGAGGGGGAGAAGGSPRNRIKTEADALMTGDSFNIRHGRSRSHFLHGSTNSTGSGAITRLLLVTPTQHPGAGGTSQPPVTHKIRKLHKKKINESIRKSVDKSLGLLHPAKNQRSLAEAEHLQGRPPSEDTEDTALSEVMQLADEIELESSFVTAFPTGDPDIAVQQARQFVRDEANYQEDDTLEEEEGEEEEEDEEEEAPVSTTAKPKITRTRLLPVNGTWARSRDSSSESDYETNVLDNEKELQPFGKLQLLNDSLGNTEWMDEGQGQRSVLNEPEAEARSQGAASMEVKQISFDSDGDGDGDSEPGMDTSEVTMDDGYPPDVQIDDKTKQLVIGDVEGEEEEVSSQITADVINARDSKIDLVSKFLQYIEQQHLMGSNCVAGTSLNLGEGVVDRYAQDRFRVEAEVAVNRANMLTRIFKTTGRSVQEDVNLLHASVLSMVEFDDDIFAAGNCFDWNEHPAQPGLFCPFAYRLPPPNLGAVFAKDLAMEYHYLGNTSEWFFLARKNAEKVIARNEQYLKFAPYLWHPDSGDIYST
uniref:Uncharacterized protein LOC108037940 isoform X2 n=1 Tax=Drosophila rhopaloa TaxID=1041015 RepID=A0A6P4E4E7_DRORH